MEIGGYLIDRQYGEWFEIWNEVSQNYEKRVGYNELIGKKEIVGYSYKSFQDNLNLIVPLNFWFCKKYRISNTLFSNN